MTTTPSTRWRLALAGGALLTAIGGPMHPDSDAKDAFLDEQAAMTADPAWVPGHSLIAIGTIVMAVGIWQAVRTLELAPRTQRALRFFAVALSLYAVETVFHAAAAVDSDALAARDFAPVAYTHFALGLVLYPLSGAALVWLGVQLHRTLSGPERVFGAIAVIAGTLHATAYPVTLAMPDLETTPMFAGAGTLMAGWGLAVGISGLRSARSRVLAPAQPALVG